MWLYKRQQLLVIKEYVRCPSLQRERERERETQARARERGRVTWELRVCPNTFARPRALPQSTTSDLLWLACESNLLLQKKRTARVLRLFARLPATLALSHLDGRRWRQLHALSTGLSNSCLAKLRPQDFQYSRKMVLVFKNLYQFMIFFYPTKKCRDYQFQLMYSRLLEKAQKGF